MEFAKTLAPLLAAGLVWCQQPAEPLSPRDLYFTPAPEEDRLPSRSQVRAGVAAPGNKSPSDAGQARRGGAVQATPSDLSSGAIPVEFSPPPPVRNLGLRYNLLLVNPATQRAEAVDPDRTFQTGECLAVELESNRSGFLYVFNLDSGGRSGPIFPTLELANESNVIQPGKKLRVPLGGCFEVAGAPGVDRVFLVLSRNLADVTQIEAAIGSPDASQGGRAREPLKAEKRFDQQIQSITAQLQSRELKVKKFARPETDSEEPHTVYAVNSSTSVPDRVVAEIRINHH